MNKLLIIVVTLVVIIGAIFLLKNNTGNQTDVSTTLTAPSAAETTTPLQQPAASESAVTLTSTGFNPQVITVKTGTKVVWTNSSGQIGNVNSVPHPTHSTYPPLNLGNFLDGATVSLIFDTAGTYGYHNHLDASKTGTVVVQ